MSLVSVLPGSDAGQRLSSERLGAYELLIELASGGMATVHLARAADRRTGPPLVAVKRPHRHLTGDKTFLTMLVDEARLASAITHPHVVKVRELGFDGGVPFIVMDYVEGASLAELRRELSAIGRALDVRVAVRIVLDALAGLQAAHELRDDTGKPLRIIHRDVSPHNVLIGCDGCTHLTDFGIAQAEDRIQTTRTHEVKGKLAYLAPERVDKRRSCTVQSDVFSMAVVLWECFAGRRLFRGEEALDILQAVVGGQIPTLRQIGAQVPESLDQVVMRGLSRDLEERYATAEDFATAITRAAGGDQIGTHADVARLMEALFGARMALRQEQVRAAVGSHSLADLLRESGLPARERGAAGDAPAGQLLAELAPPAPTARYAHESDLRAGPTRLRARRIARALAGVATGIAIGAVVTWAVVARAPRSPASVSPPAPTTSRIAVAVASTRKLVVRLPFVASQVVLDDARRELDPASDVVVFDVPSKGARHHRLTVTAADGARAEGEAQETDGVASLDVGYELVPAPEPAGAFEGRRDPTGARPARPIGTVHDGFTKLR